MNRLRTYLGRCRAGLETYSNHDHGCTVQRGDHGFWHVCKCGTAWMESGR